jgi:hypothetical protein
MRSILPDWEIELARWLKPFLEQLGHKARRRMCPPNSVEIKGFSPIISDRTPA